MGEPEIISAREYKRRVFQILQKIMQPVYDSARRKGYEERISVWMVITNFSISV